MKRVYWAVLLCMAGAAFQLHAADAGATAPAAHDHNPQTVTIEMTANGFEPQEVTINQGDTVLFRNADTKDHWPASDIHPTHQIYPAFDPKRGVPPEQGWSFTFTRDGSWGMHDHLNPELTGTIHVNKVDGFVDTSADAGAELPSGFFHAIKMSALRVYYKLFPAKLTAALANVQFMKIASDQKQIGYWLELVGPKGAMTKILSESGNGNTIDCHTQAHQVGRVAYKIYGASVFKDGDDSCHSGFYHGAMSASIAP